MRLQSKIKTKVWGFLALLPAIIFIGYIAINTMQARTSLTIANDYYSQISIIITNLRDNILGGVYDSNICQILRKFINLLYDGTFTTDSIDFCGDLVATYSTYLMFLELLKVIVNAICLLPNIVNKFIDKLTDK